MTSEFDSKSGINITKRRVDENMSDEVLRIKKRLEKGGDDAKGALDLLKALRDINMDLNLLTTTRIGMTVNALRKSSRDEDVVAMAKSLIKAWKKFVPDQAPSAPSSTPSSSKTKAKNGNDKVKDDSKASSASPSALKSSFPARPNPTTDEVRLRCRELINNALKSEALPDGVYKPPEEIAELIEDGVFKKFRNTDMKYKAQIRSRVFNLKDKKNPALRENVLLGRDDAEEESGIAPTTKFRREAPTSR